MGLSTASLIAQSGLNTLTTEASVLSRNIAGANDTGIYNRRRHVRNAANRSREPTCMTSSISTQTITSLLRQSVLQMQSDLATGETEMTTGNYADIGETLGAQTGESVSLQTENSLLQTITDTNQSVGTRLSTTQTILGNLQTSAQNLLNSLLQGNGSTSDASTWRKQFAKLNFQFKYECQRRYIFAGTNTGDQPITNYYAPSAANQAALDNAFLSEFGIPQTSSSVSTISGSSMQNFLDNQFASLFQGTNWSSNWSSANP
jgi:flagellar hook-associated protein 3 FlgL